jgi:hypothetical protein
MATFPNTGIRSAHGAGTKNTGTPWWVVFYEPIGTRSPGTALAKFMVVKAASKSAAESQVQSQGAAVLSTLGPFVTQSAAETAARKSHETNVKASGGKDVTGFPNPVAWFQQATGGILAGALEQGFIQIIKDLWAVIEGPVEVIGGALIIIVTLAIYFKNDIASVAGMVAMAA